MRDWAPSRPRHNHASRKWGGQSRVYRIWTGMVNRCTNPKNRSYHKYGARGITVCDRWRKFENFLTDMGEPPTGSYQIERKKNNEGYAPGNCRWATPKEQAANRRSSRPITFRGRTQTLQAWADELGMRHSALIARLKVWPLERAMTEPPRNWGPGKPKSR